VRTLACVVGGVVLVWLIVAVVLYVS